MSIIKVNCPSCKSPLQIPEHKLRETQGRVVCHECQHIFRLVKKNKKAASQAKPRSEQPQRPIFNEVGSVSDLDEIHKTDPVWPTDGWPSGEEVKRPKPQSQAQPQPKKKKSSGRPDYRIPKAENKPREHFANVGQQQPFAFNLLDPKTANMQVPQVSINPSAEEKDGQEQSVSPPAVRTNNGEQQNNITIHTGSLVFTLVGDGQNSSTTLTAPENNPSPPVAPVAVQVPVSGVSGSELNWTIATIAALIVLIVQFFYFILMTM